MHKQSGEVSLSTSVLESGLGLVTQEAWIQHATVRDNILFGRTYEKTRYEAVVYACALNDDLKVRGLGSQTHLLKPLEFFERWRKKTVSPPCVMFSLSCFGFLNLQKPVCPQKLQCHCCYRDGKR